MPANRFRTEWRPMTEHVFPWPEKTLLVAVFPRHGEPVVDVWRVTVGEHGALFETPPHFFSLHELGWVPFAWRIDDTPERNDRKWPPLWADYLTKETEATAVMGRHPAKETDDEC